MKLLMLSIALLAATFLGAQDFDLVVENDSLFIDLQGQRAHISSAQVSQLISSEKAQTAQLEEELRLLELRREIKARNQKLSSLQKLATAVAAKEEEELQNVKKDE